MIEKEYWISWLFKQLVKIRNGLKTLDALGYLSKFLKKEKVKRMRALMVIYAFLVL